jgi:hypothetical protein
MPGDLLLRPVPLVALGLLAVNDHLLKREFGNAVTGKLSDIAGLVFVPLLAVAVVELLRAAGHFEWRASTRTLGACVVSVGLIFTAAKVSPMMAHLFGDILGAVRFPVRGELDRVTITHDVSDLVALPALAIARLDASRSIRLRKSAVRQQPCTRTSDPVAPT